MKKSIAAKILDWYRRHFIVGSLCTVVVTAALVVALDRTVFLKNFRPANKTHNAAGEFVQKTLGEDEDNALIDQSADYAKSVVFHGPRNRKRIALTFDADMTTGMKVLLISGRVKSYFDRDLITYLETTHTKATLFLTGMWIEQYSAATKELAANPLFELGNHSYSHPSFYGYCYGLPQRPRDQLIEEVALTEELLRSYTGKDNVLFRFPGGCFNATGVELAHLAGDTVIQWDVVAGDGFNHNEKGIEYKVLSAVQSGSIIVMHMNGAPNDPVTSRAVQVIVPALKAQGYEFVTVSDLLGR